MLILALLVTQPTYGWGRSQPQPISTEEAVTTLVGASQTQSQAMSKLIELADGIGARISGSPELEQAVQWAAVSMERDGLSNVHLEPVMVNHWVRGEESLTMTAPASDDLPMLGLGMSVGTPPEGISGEVVVVDSFDHLNTLGKTVAGKIVLFDVPFTTYGETVQYRVDGANQASRLGAAAMLVRSVGPVSLSTPHTGTLHYDDVASPIPAAAVSIEGATRIHRLVDAGVMVNVTLKMEAYFAPKAESANVIAEVIGRESPNEVVVVGCHLDSWDVGTGAQDDGAGCVTAMEVGRLIAKLPNAPRRTVRVVLFTNEENGLAGGKAYAKEHAAELPDHVALLEMDTGAGTPLGFRVDVRSDDEDKNQKTRDEVAALLAPLSHLGADTFELAGSGADIGPSVAQSGLGLGLMQDTSGYWPVHHTEADTVDKIDEATLNQNLAVMSVATWLLAEAPEVPRNQPAKSE